MRILGLLTAAVVVVACILVGGITLMHSPLLDAVLSADDAVKNGTAAYDQADYTAALRLFQKAAEKENMEAEWRLGILYRDGKGVSRDDAQALVWLRKAADRGYAAAQVDLGRMHANGKGTKQDDTQAVAWFRKAADQGDAAGQANLGWSYANGRGVQTDEAQAAAWYRRAADQGEAFSQNALGSYYANGRGGLTKNDREAAAWYAKAADQENTNAQINLAAMYVDGRGVARDDAKALNLIRQATDRKSAVAQNFLGWMYENGRGMTRDYQEAMNWYRQSAENGSADGKANLLRMEAYAPGKLTVLFTNVRAKDFANGHASSCQLVANVHNNTKYHLNGATFKIGALKFAVSELSANSYLDSDEIGYIDVSDGSADCGSMTQYLLDKIQSTEIYKCDMTGIAEGDCQAVFKASTNISSDTLKKIQESEAELSRKQLAPLTAALADFGISMGNFGQNSQEKYAQLLNRLIKIDSASWSYNKYREGSVNNVNIIDRGKDGSSITFKGSFSYMDGNTGWAKLTLFKSRLPCIEFWDFEGRCRLVRLPRLSQN